MTERTGAKGVVENLVIEFIRKVDVEDLAAEILRYFEKSEEEKIKVSEKARKLSELSIKVKCAKDLEGNFIE